MQNVYVNGTGKVSLVKAGRFIKSICHKNPMVECSHKCVAWQEDETGNFITLACLPGTVLCIEKDSRKKPLNALTSGGDAQLALAPPTAKARETYSDPSAAKQIAKKDQPELDNWN
jgi:hypothetical protein